MRDIDLMTFTYTGNMYKIQLNLIYLLYYFFKYTCGEHFMQ